MRFQERKWCAALFNSPTKEMARKYRSRTRIWYSSNFFHDFFFHDLFIAILFAYGFDNKALRFIYDYLRHRKERTRIGDSYSLWQEILCGVPQGSILRAFLFNADPV